MYTSTVTANTKSTGCGCGGGGGKSSATPCGCGGKGCTQCESPSQGYSRPLFFSGQLLTEDDLQSLVDYTVAKNRLHNRMLFGEGVVCGLEVKHDPCDAQKIVVTSGYSLDCCGDDIVVPCEVTLEITGLIRDLRARLRGKDCGEPCKPSEVQGADEQPAGIREIDKAALDAMHRLEKRGECYCLYVVYCEQSGDPVAPYDGDTCGGDGCRDTRVREGFRFELRCPPAPPVKAVQSKAGSVYGARTPWAKGIVDSLIFATEDFNEQTVQHVLTKWQAAFLASGADADPSLMKTLSDARQLPLEEASRARFASLVSGSLRRWLSQADCEALLPACQPCHDDGVLIACLEVDHCKVTKICNEYRVPILTPAYLHQLGITEWWQRLLLSACCDDRSKALELRDHRRAEDTVRELRQFVDRRLEEIGSTAEPEVRATLLPQLAKSLGAAVLREQDVSSRERELEGQVHTLRTQLDEVQAWIAKRDKSYGNRKEGGTP